MERRPFLSLLALWGLPVWARRQSQNLGVVMGASRLKDMASGAEAFAWEVVDLEGRQRRSISLGFFGHGFAQDPKDPRRAMIFEKRGAGAAEVDLRAGALTAVIPPSPGCHFYGHGVFLKGGDVFVAAETLLESKAGQMTVRDSKDRKILGTFPTYGARPHDCVLIDGGKVLAITNGGGDLKSTDRPCVSFVDVASHKLLQRAYPTKEHINTGHLAFSKRGDLVVVSAPREGMDPKEKGGVSFRRKGDKASVLRTMEVPKTTVDAMAGETLSIAMLEALHAAVVTSPAGNQLSIWDLATLKLHRELKLDGPRGVALTLDGRYLIVSHGPKATLSLFDARTLEPAPQLRMEDIRIGGSHLFVIPNPRA